MSQDRKGQDMQNKVLRVNANQTGTKVLVSLPDPDRHAAMSDDFDSSDWTAFHSAKASVKAAGFAYNAPNKVWYAPLDTNTDDLVSKLNMLAAHMGWIFTNTIDRDRVKFQSQQQPRATPAAIVLTNQDKQLFGHTDEDFLRRIAAKHSDKRLGQVAQALLDGVVKLDTVKL